MTRPAACVVVVPVDDPAVTAACLSRLLPTLRPADRVVLLVPNGTPTPARSRAQLLRGEPGESLAALRDRALATAGTELVAELHADVTVTPHWLDRLAAALEGGAAAAGPRAGTAPPAQALLGAAYDDGRTSLRDFARLRAVDAAAPTRADAPLGRFCRVSRPGARGPEVVVHSVFVHHAAAAGCPDAAPLPPEPGPLVSGALIVKDEQECLPACLEALRPFVDEVVVYDTGSTDRTREIAAAAGARVVQGFWDDDFGAARNRGLTACTGRWVLVVDADETVTGDPARLREELAATAWDGYAVGICNTSSGGVGSTETHFALRLFQRADAVYVGTLHEQVVHRRRGHVLNGPVAPHLLLQHSGYTPERFAERSKARRNAELAEAGWREAVRTGTDVSRNAGNLARALYAAGERERAMELFDQAWDGSASRTGLLLCTAAVGCALDLGRPALAETWLERLAANGASGPRLQVHRARILARSAREAEAVAVLERLPATATDDDGVRFERTSTAALHSRLLERLDRPDDAAQVLLLALADGVSDRHLAELLQVLRAAGRPAADLAAALPEHLRTAFLAQCLQVPPLDAHEVLDALWERDPRLDVLAAASSVAPGLPVPQALEWSARLRGRGLADLCPLRHIAHGDRSARDRVVAAAVALTTFSDETALPLLEGALATVDAQDEATVLAELAVLAPGLVEPAPA